MDSAATALSETKDCPKLLVTQNDICEFMKFLISGSDHLPEDLKAFKDVFKVSYLAYE